LLSDTCLLLSNSYDKNISFIDLDGCCRDTNVKRSAGIAQPERGDATDLEAQGVPGFSAAKGSADVDNSKQQSWARQRHR